MPAKITHLFARFCSRRGLLLLLCCLLTWLPVSAAWGAEVAVIRLQPHELAVFEAPAPELIAQADPASQPQPPDRSDLWTNSAFALGGSLLSNLLLVAVIAGLSLGQSALAPGGPDWIDLLGPSALLLELLPTFGAPLLMHVWSPEADASQFGWSLLGTILGTALHLVLMLPVYLYVDSTQKDASDTVFVILPIAVGSAVLLQALGAGWGHELGENWSVSSERSGGLRLTRHWRF